MEGTEHKQRARDRSAKDRNRLRFEKSPYLLQHANNPVDWYPWGPEPFERARRDNKPIFPHRRFDPGNLPGRQLPDWMFCRFQVCDRDLINCEVRKKVVATCHVV